jgi:hypothetical protein
VTDSYQPCFGKKKPCYRYEEKRRASSQATACCIAAAAPPFPYQHRRSAVSSRYISPKLAPLIIIIIIGIYESGRTRRPSSCVCPTAADLQGLGHCRFAHRGLDDWRTDAPCSERQHRRCCQQQHVQLQPMINKREIRGCLLPLLLHMHTIGYLERCYLSQQSLLQSFVFVLC